MFSTVTLEPVSTSTPYVVNMKSHGVEGGHCPITSPPWTQMFEPLMRTGYKVPVVNCAADASILLPSARLGLWYSEVCTPLKVMVEPAWLRHDVAVTGAAAASTST